MSKQAMSRSSPTAEEAPSQYLTFMLGEEVFAMDIRTVREIIQVGPMTTVPLMPAFVRGVINLRGAVVPVIDLQARFGRAVARLTKKTCIVIFDAVRDNERVELGLREAARLARQGQREEEKEHELAHGEQSSPAAASQV